MIDIFRLAAPFDIALGIDINRYASQERYRACIRKTTTDQLGARLPAGASPYFFSFTAVKKLPGLYSGKDNRNLYARLPAGASPLRKN